MEKFIKLFLEGKGKSAEDVVDILNKYDATIINQIKPSEKDVIRWGNASIQNAEEDGFADAFDMKPRKFIEFCELVINNAKEISKILSK